MKEIKSNEKTLSVYDNTAIAKKSDPIPAPKPAPVKIEKKKKKSPVVPIIIIVVSLLLLGAAGFFGYRFYAKNLSKDILSDFTGTWVYDTATEQPGYVSFLGNEDVVVNNTSYDVTATKKTLTFKNSEKDTVKVEYLIVDDNIFLSLPEENELLGTCNPTVNGTDAGIMLIKISDSHSLDEDTIKEKYYEQFPENKPGNENFDLEGIIEGSVDWESLMDDFNNGSFNFDNIDDYLYSAGDNEALDDYLSGILGDNYEDYFSGDVSTEEALGEIVGGFLEGYIDDFGGDVNNEVSDAFEDWGINDAYDNFNDYLDFYNQFSEEDIEAEDILDSLFSW